MTEALNRDELIQLLDKLGSEDDAEVLAAARDAQARVAAADLGWDDLLVPEQAAAQDDDEEEPAAETDQPAPPSDAGDTGDVGDAEDTGDGGGGDAEALALIGKLLARKDISQELRDELEGYRVDISEGEFVDADRRYLRAMHQRLSK